MKKYYTKPAIECLAAETEALLEASLPVVTDEDVTEEKVLGRDFNLFDLGE